MASTRHPHRLRAALGVLLALSLALLCAVSLRPAPAAAAEALLPNVVADPPDNVSLETSTTEGGLKSSGEAKLLLRFNGYIHNVGPGALDFRGSRKSSSEPMKAFQRVYNSDGSFKEEPSSAELVYVTADGHEHWHLQRAARYSLWNAAKSAEVAPAQKVGFCLDDSEHVEPAVGPSEAVYSDATGREFCRQHQPEATSLFEGVSPGWRDLYKSNLAFQWVDASEVLPGEYWLREDVNTTGVIKETGGANAPSYATKPTIIPGFDATGQVLSVPAKEARTIILTSTAWDDAGAPRYTILGDPQHGTLSALSGGHVLYTPEAGYAGPDAFTFAAADPNSPFPNSPATATVSIEVAKPPQPSVTIEGLQEEMIVGTGVTLTAVVGQDSGGVEWSTSGGTITHEGSTALFLAPASPTTVTVTARLKDASVSAQRVIRVVAAPVSTPAAEVPVGSPGAGGQAGYKVSSAASESSATPGVSRPRAMLMGRRLIMTTSATVGGRVRLSAFLHGHRLGTCVAETPAGRPFTCRLNLRPGVALSSRIRIVASLRAGHALVESVLAAGRIPRMKMTPARAGARAASAGMFWCSPATLQPSLVR